jgi:uroporphyrinogen decarboxylase
LRFLFNRGKQEQMIFLETLAKKFNGKHPLWMMRQAGRYLPEYRQLRQQTGSFLTCCLIPDVATEITLQPIHRFGFDAAIIFSDILIIPHGLGQYVGFYEGEGPKLSPIRHQDELRQLSLTKMLDKLAPVYQAISQTRAALPASTALIGFAGAPWTVLSYMVEGKGKHEFLTILKWVYQDPKGFSELLAMVVKATIQHLNAQIEAGATVVQLFESWAGALPAGLVQSLSLTPLQTIIDGVKAVHPDTPIIIFPKGAGLHYPQYAALNGIAAMGVDQHQDINKMPQDIVLQGNLDPAVLLAGGDALKQAIISLKESIKGKPHIMNLGHGINQHTPIQHVETLVEIVRE